MIYATHKLYDCLHQLTTFKVVVTENGYVSDICDFECEKHSMQWYDAIILSSKISKNSFFKTFSEVIEYLGSNCDKKEPIYAYGVTYDSDGWCMLTLLK